jgi:hypothetical protein
MVCAGICTLFYAKDRRQRTHRQDFLNQTKCRLNLPNGWQQDGTNQVQHGNNKNIKAGY